MVFYKRSFTEWFCICSYLNGLLSSNSNKSASFHTTQRGYFCTNIILYSLPPPLPSTLPRPTLLFLSTLQVFTDENSAECSSAGESGAEHQVPRLSLSEVVHIRTISASGDLISLQQEDEKFSKQLEKGKVR